MGGAELREWVTFGLAVLGAALGVINAWKSWVADRVRLKVLPASAFGNDGTAYLSIEVRNLSAFPVTVTAAGFEVRGSATHIQIIRPVLLGADRLPVRLESRAAVTVLAPLAALEKDQVATVRSAYITTACGLRLTRSSKVLRQVVKAATTA